MIRYAPVDGLRVVYETLGDPAGRPLLLIMGLASQMLIWDDGFCARLAATQNAIGVSAWLRSGRVGDRSSEIDVSKEAKIDCVKWSIKAGLRK